MKGKWMPLEKYQELAHDAGYVQEMRILRKQAQSSLDECLDAIVYHRKRGGDARVASSWFLNLLKRHGRVKPVEGEDLDAFVRPEVE